MTSSFSENKLFLSLCSLSLMIFALYIVFELEVLLTGISYASLSIYFGLVGWDKIPKSWLVFFGCLAFVSFAIILEVGISMPYFAVIAITITSMSFIHQFFAK